MRVLITWTIWGASARWSLAAFHWNPIVMDGGYGVMDPPSQHPAQRPSLCPGPAPAQTLGPPPVPVPWPGARPNPRPSARLCARLPPNTHPPGRAQSFLSGILHNDLTRFFNVSALAWAGLNGRFFSGWLRRQWPSTLSRRFDLWPNLDCPTTSPI